MEPSLSKPYWLPPVTKVNTGCLSCGAPHAIFPPEGHIAVGFGSAALTKDGEEVWCEQDADDFHGCMTGAQAEARALADPDHDWRINLNGPLSGRTYQRQGPGHWVLVKQDQGFA